MDASEVVPQMAADDMRLEAEDNGTEAHHFDLTQEDTCETNLPLQHLVSAVNSPWPQPKRVTIDADVMHVLARFATSPDDVIKERASALQHWTFRAASLEPERRQMMSELPSHLLPTVGRIHVPLLREMLEAAGHEDATLIDDMVEGFRVIGELTAGGLGKTVEGGKLRGGRPAHGRVPDLERLRKNCLQLNQENNSQAEAE